MQARKAFAGGVLALGLSVGAVSGAGSAVASPEHNNDGPVSSVVKTVTKTVKTTNVLSGNLSGNKTSFLNGNKLSAFNGAFSGNAVLSGNTLKVNISAGNGILKDGIGNGNVLRNLFFSPSNKSVTPAE